MSIREDLRPVSEDASEMRRNLQQVRPPIEALSPYGFSDYSIYVEQTAIQARSLLEFGEIARGTDLIDCGTGFGRLAIALAHHIGGRDGRYLGLGADSPALGWALDNVATFFPQVSFAAVSAKGALVPSRHAKLPLAPAWSRRDRLFDAGVSATFLNHNRIADVAPILRCAAGMMRPGALFSGTFFLVDEWFEKLRARGLFAEIEVKDDGAHVGYPGPTQFVGYSRQGLATELAKAGLRLLHVSGGSWTGERSANHYLDYFVATPIGP